MFKNAILLLLIVTVLASPVYAQEETNIIEGPLAGMNFIPVPGGEFTMGSPGDEGGRSENEGPARTLTIDPFYMMITEVTQGQWKELMGSDIEQLRDSTHANWLIYGEGKNHPVYYVSWTDVHSFLDSLNIKDPGKNYRLPTEAEWEYACRAGTTTRYYSSDNASSLDSIAWFKRNSKHECQKVAQKVPNPFGLYDMIGNVWEWCEDHWHISYENAPDNGDAWLDSALVAYMEQIEAEKLAATDSTLTDSLATDSLATDTTVVEEVQPEELEEEIDTEPVVIKRVIRGGSFKNYPKYLRSAYRAGFVQEKSDNAIGFRIVYDKNSP